eukprot:s1865_g24.t1
MGNTVFDDLSSCRTSGRRMAAMKLYLRTLVSLAAVATLVDASRIRRPLPQTNPQEARHGAVPCGWRVSLQLPECSQRYAYDAGDARDDTWNDAWDEPSPSPAASPSACSASTRAASVRSLSAWDPRKGQISSGKLGGFHPEK